MNGSSASRRPGWGHGWSNKWKGTWEPYQYTWRAWSQPSKDDAEGEWKFVKKKSRKRKTEVNALPSETPPLSPQDPHQTDQEVIDSDRKVKAHRTFLEAVLNDAPVPCPRTEQLEDQEKKAAHVTRLEAMIDMANTPEMAELHKSLSAELARVTKTVKSQPNSVRLEKKLAWIAREERRLSELEADIRKASEVLTTRRATVQEEKKAADAIKLELVQHQTMDVSMGVSSMDDLEKKELSILRKLAAAAMAPGSFQAQGNEQEHTNRLTRSLSEVQTEIAAKKQRVA